MNSIMIIFLICLFSFCIYKNINVFDLYIEGVKQSLGLIIPIFCSMMAFLLFITLLRSCGIIELMTQYLSIYIDIPVDLLIMSLLRPISANASLSYLYIIYNTFGVDHLYSLIATLIQCSSDTTLYVVTLYFSSIHIKDSKYSIQLGLFLDFLSVSFVFLILKFIV